MKRQRGRNRKPGSGGGNANAANPNRSWDSQGPENIKVRGNAQTVYERYQQLARDAGSSGDRVLAENYLQHAEHYFRVLRALQPQRPVSEIAARELSNQGYDIDFEDETGAQAAAFMAAQAAADRAAQPQNEARDGGDQPAREPREWRDRDQNRDRDQGQNRDQNRDREWQPRPPREDNRPPRDDARPAREDAEPRAEGEQGQGGRRETRRERWERRREERNRRFEAEGGQPDTRSYEEAEGRSDVERADSQDAPPPVAVVPAVEALPDVVEAAPKRPARRTRTPRRDVEDDSTSALPGFLTRSAAPAAVQSADAEPVEEAAPKRRAPRRKTATPAENE